ncbi:MAG: lipase family protein [Holosporales bacterium]
MRKTLGTGALYLCTCLVVLGIGRYVQGVSLEDDLQGEALSRKLTPHFQGLEQELIETKVRHQVVPSAHHEPLILEQGGGGITSSTFLKAMHGTALEMNDLSYAIGKGQVSRIAQLKTRFANEGWTVIRDIIGRSGRDNKSLDIPGFVAYNPRSNVFMVVLRGSATEADWSTNMDAERVSARSLGIDMEGMVHRGFGMKYKAMEDQLFSIMNQILDSLTPEQKKNARVVVTGHSQGGGLAPLVLAQLAHKLGKMHWGEGFNNEAQNKFVGMFFSAARVFADAAAAEWVERTVGKSNQVRHNMGSNRDDAIISIQDPVPNLSLNTTWQAKVSGLPIIGPYLAKQYGGFYDTGYLMMDDSIEAIKRISPKGIRAVLKTSGTNFLDLMKQKFTPGITMPLRVASLPLAVIEWGANSAKGMVTAIFAPVHGGSTVSDPSGAFDPKAFGSNLDFMLKKGLERSQAKPVKPEKPQESKGLLPKAGEKIVEGVKKFFRAITGF